MIGPRSGACWNRLSIAQVDQLRLMAAVGVRVSSIASEISARTDDVRESLRLAGWSVAGNMILARKCS